MADLFAEKKQSLQSFGDSTKSEASNYEPYEQPRKSMRSSYMFGVARKTRQSIGAYSSLFARVRVFLSSLTNQLIINMCVYQICI